MKSYLCANRHHFHSTTPTCPTGGCTAEVRPTAVHPLHGRAPAFEKLPQLPEDQRPAATPAPAPTPSPAAQDGVKHSIRWWAVVGDGERVRRTSGMKDTGNWDATCSCGWDSRTGGVIMNEVDRMAQAHKAGIL